MVSSCRSFQIRAMWPPGFKILSNSSRVFSGLNQWNAWAAIRGEVPLPPAGSVVPVRKVTAIACENDDPAILRALMVEALRTRDDKLTLVGMSAADPLAPAMDGLRGRGRLLKSMARRGTAAKPARPGKRAARRLDAA